MLSTLFAKNSVINPSNFYSTKGTSYWYTEENKR